jgi:tRNA A37 methylthiotransferase MiaB
VDAGLVAERLAELGELQDRITASRRDALVGRTVEVLVDRPGVGRSHREAPEIDGVVHIPEDLVPGTFVEVDIVAALGPDVDGAPVAVASRS